MSPGMWGVQKLTFPRHHSLPHTLRFPPILPPQHHSQALCSQRPLCLLLKPPPLLKSSLHYLLLILTSLIFSEPHVHSQPSPLDLGCLADQILLSSSLTSHLQWWWWRRRSGWSYSPSSSSFKVGSMPNVGLELTTLRVYALLTEPARSPLQ